MLPAFTFSISPWTVISLVFTTIWQTVLSHGVSATIIIGVIAVTLVAVLVPGGLALVRTALGAVAHFLLGTATGRIVLLALACLVGGWEARAFLDKSIVLRQQLETQLKATAAAQSAAAAARLQAFMLHDLNDAAAKRAEAAETQSEDLQEQVSDYAAQLVAVDKGASGAKVALPSYALTAADVTALRRIGAASAPRSH